MHCYPPCAPSLNGTSAQPSFSIIFVWLFLFDNFHRERKMEFYVADFGEGEKKRKK